MTDAPKPPNRRRRKIIVAFVVLVLVSMVSWWYWPRGDARFVGRWEWWIEDATSPDSIITLNRNGQAIIEDLGTMSKSSTCWSVRYNCLCFGFDKRSKWYDSAVHAVYVIKDSLGLDFVPDGHGHLILEVTSPDDIRLSSWMILNGDPNIILHRIPE